LNLTQEIIKFTLLGTAYWAYMNWVSHTVTEEIALLVNGFIAPFLVGAVGYLIFRSQGTVRVILAMGISLFAALVVTAGGDPAKPGLHLVAIAAMTAISFLGAVSIAGVVVALQSLRARQKQHKP
jgi:hypothetical protein